MRGQKSDEGPRRKGNCRAKATQSPTCLGNSPPRRNTETRQTVVLNQTGKSRQCCTGQRESDVQRAIEKQHRDKQQHEFHRDRRTGQNRENRQPTRRTERKGVHKQVGRPRSNSSVRISGRQPVPWRLKEGRQPRQVGLLTRSERSCT